HRGHAERAGEGGRRRPPGSVPCEAEEGGGGGAVRPRRDGVGRHDAQGGTRDPVVELATREPVAAEFWTPCRAEQGRRRDEQSAQGAPGARTPPVLEHRYLHEDLAAGLEHARELGEVAEDDIAPWEMLQDE